MGTVRLQGVTKSYRDRAAVKDVSLTIPEGSFTCLLGPSGCGKTTTLRIIGGFVSPDAGSVEIDGIEQGQRPPQDRPTAMVFQDYALFPHLTVADNVGYGLKVRGEGQAAIKAKVQEVMGLLRLEDYGDRLPRQLSGGQQQRVALARSLVMEPQVLLMDEPLSNLDAKLRIRLRTELRALQKRLGITTIYVTHDQEEAMAMADEVVVMDGGAVVQVGSPRDVYRSPETPFVADFIGHSNFLRGTRAADGVQVANQVLAVGHCTGVAVGEPALLAVRPEAMRLHDPGSHLPADVNSLTGAIVASQFLGAMYRYWVEIGGQEVVVDEPAEQAAEMRHGDVLVSFAAAASRAYSVEAAS